MHRILIADDEKEIIKLLRLYLEKDHIKVTEAYDGAQAYKLSLENSFDLAIIDIMMPKLNGFELIKKIREKSNIPIMILSAKVQTSDKIFGLEIGADDYITKPFDAMEVVARVYANLRRFHQLGATQNVCEKLSVQNLTLDTGECVIYRDKQRIDLTSGEYKLLQMFMSSPGRVYTKEQIYQAGWGGELIVDDNTIRVAISKLRDKIGEEKN